MNKHIRTRQFRHLTMAHLKDVARQPAVLFWGVIFPILLAIGLGMAFTRDTETIHHIGFIQPGGHTGDHAVKPSEIEDLFKRAVNDYGYKLTIRDETSFELAMKNDTLGDTYFVFESNSWEALIIKLKQGRINLIMEKTASGLVYHFDPVNPHARLAWLTVSPFAGEGTSMVLDAKPEATVSPMELPGTRYIDFLIPGLVSMTVMMSCMWGISYGMIDKRSKKLLRRMVATPMVKSHFLGSLVLVRIFINTVESFLLVLAAWLIFDIVIQGSFKALIMVFLAGNIAFCGIAVFVSSRTANTEVGNGMINAVVMPMTLLSGVFFSYYNFPDWSIPIIEKLPLTLLADGIRAIFTEGAGLAETIPAAIVLFLMGAVFFTAGLKVFKWH